MNQPIFNKDDTSTFEGKQVSSEESLSSWNQIQIQNKIFSPAPDRIVTPAIAQHRISLHIANQDYLERRLDYVGNVRYVHAEVKMNEVRQHLQNTYFTWMGGLEDNGVFYYRIHSPVVLIEFDHQAGQALGNSEPSRNHIHTVVRTPNGNDYGKDLLRQHYQQSRHSY